MRFPSDSRWAVVAALFLSLVLVFLMIGNWSNTAPPGAVAAETRETAGSVPGKMAKARAKNKQCYVCHPALKTEEINTVHLEEGYACTKCHGASNDHMDDEMQMTTPDLLYGRCEVDAMCGECHEDSHEDVEPEVAAFLEKWRGRPRENGRAVTENSICTDCHGTHNLDMETKTDVDKSQLDWLAAFNGQDLTGWKPSGKAAWKIRLGRITGTPDGDGTLWNETEYEDYQVAVTFRADFPVHAGIYVRATGSDPGPRVEIFQQKDPAAYTGSVALPGKELVLVNLKESSFDAGGWNTLAVEVRGPRVAVWLNGAEIGAVRCLDAPKGRLGLYIKGGPEYQRGELAVREVKIQKLEK